MKFRQQVASLKRSKARPPSSVPAPFQGLGLSVYLSPSLQKMKSLDVVPKKLCTDAVRLWRNPELAPALASPPPERKKERHNLGSVLLHSGPSVGIRMGSLLLEGVHRTL